LPFSSPSPPPAWPGDFHPQAVEHVRHTMKKPLLRQRLFYDRKFAAYPLRCPSHSPSTVPDELSRESIRIWRRR
jgi:hypothetical protein